MYNENKDVGQMRIIKKSGKQLVKEELKRSYLFFMKEANLDPESKGYGLIRDKTSLAEEIASTASVGYGLAALVIGVEHDWISFSSAYERASRTLETFEQNVEGKQGFFYHFVNLKTGKREWNCEISIIDTAIFICGAITCGEYFGGKVKARAQKLYEKINWEWYRNPDTNQFYMGYTPEKGFWGKWDMYAEQLMLYVLGAASPTYPVPSTMDEEIEKPVGEYKTIHNLIYTYCGTLFTYQFSHAWIDFRGKVDKKGIDWFENSIKATKANRQYCIDHQKQMKTYGEKSWGLTACVGPNGYSGGYGAMPAIAQVDKENDGTVAPCGAIGSIVFTPQESIELMEFLYHQYPKLWDKYGFKDAYNLEGEHPWYATEYIGIDKGISMVMIENYLSGTIWQCFMKNEMVQKGMKLLGFRPKLKEKESVFI